MRRKSGGRLARARLVRRAEHPEIRRRLIGEERAAPAAVERSGEHEHLPVAVGLGRTRNADPRRATPARSSPFTSSTTRSSNSRERGVKPYGPFASCPWPWSQLAI